MQTRDPLVAIGRDGSIAAATDAALDDLCARAGTFRLEPGPDVAILLSRQDAGPPRLMGRVERATLTAAVVFASTARWQGELLVVGAERRSIFFDDGAVIGAQSSAPGERIGEVMRHAGAISQAHVDSVTQALRTQPGRRFGEIAVDLGLVTRDELFRMMRRQTEQVTLAALASEEGCFYFLAKLDERKLARHQSIGARALVRAAARQVAAIAQFRERFRPDRSFPLRRAARERVPSDLGLVFDACDGRRSIQELPLVCDMTPLQVAAALSELVQLELVEVTTPAGRDLRALVEGFDAALRLIFQRAAAHRSTDWLSEQLAAFAENAGPYVALFAGAGPAKDGTVNVERIAKNVERMAGDNPVDSVGGHLHEYAAYALFCLSSRLPREAYDALSSEVRAQTVALASPREDLASEEPARAPKTSSRPSTRAKEPSVRAKSGDGARGVVAPRAKDAALLERLKSRLGNVSMGDGEGTLDVEPGEVEISDSLEAEHRGPAEFLDDNRPTDPPSALPPHEQARTDAPGAPVLELSMDELEDFPTEPPERKTDRPPDDEPSP